jgi:protease-4
MSLDADAIADRRRLKRHLFGWRLFALVLLIAVALAAVWRDDGIAIGERVVQLDVTGIILDDQDRLHAIRRLATENAVRAVVVRIDSPGGTVVGGEELYRALREVAEAKPVVATIAGTGASAAYMIALAADRIVARENSIVGSIGVILQNFNAAGLLDKIGVQPDMIRSAPLKDQPNPFEPMPAAARSAIQAVVDDTYRWFVDLVATRRGLSPAVALQLSDGRVYTGRQAFSLNLIDGTGGIDDARAWLAESRGISRDLPLVPFQRDNALELPEGVFGLARKMLLSETLKVDGLLALWQPEVLR